MKFKKYSSIENSYREKEIEKIVTNGFASDDIEYIVTEKVHGTHLSLLSDRNDVKVAKRTSILNDAELSKFYDADIMYDKYKDNIKELAKYIIDKYDANEVQIFGEHFGGIYNDETEKGYSKIQKEVQYIPFTDFIVFDILLKNNYKDVFMNWDEVKNLSNKFGLKIVPELFRGTFEEALEYPNEFITKVPELYGLEPIEGNICEGVVIKPLKDLRLPTGDRVILKNKNDKFKEKGKVKKSKNKAVKTLTDDEKRRVQEITRYFEENRIQNVLSKGDVKLDWKQFGKLSGLFFKDALEDFIKDNPEFNELDKGTKKLIQRYAQVEAQDFVREFMKKHI